jgi:hypothetical protein
MLKKPMLLLAAVAAVPPQRSCWPRTSLKWSRRGLLLATGISRFYS